MLMLMMFQCGRHVVQRASTSVGGVPAGGDVWLVEDGHCLPRRRHNRSVRSKGGSRLSLTPAPSAN